MDQTWRIHYKYKNYAADSHGQVKNVKTNSIINTMLQQNIRLVGNTLLG
jgi:hypothetical protein